MLYVKCYCNFTRGGAKQSGRLVHRRRGHHLPGRADVHRDYFGRMSAHGAQALAAVVQRPYPRGLVERSGQSSAELAFRIGSLTRARFRERPRRRTASSQGLGFKYPVFRVIPNVTGYSLRPKY